MKPNPVMILVGLFALGWLFLQMCAGCIALLGLGLGCGADFAIVAGFLLAVGLVVVAIATANRKA